MGKMAQSVMLNNVVHRSFLIDGYRILSSRYLDSTVCSVLTPVRTKVRCHRSDPPKADYNLNENPI